MTDYCHDCHDQFQQFSYGEGFRVLGAPVSNRHVVQVVSEVGSVELGTKMRHMVLDNLEALRTTFRAADPRGSGQQHTLIQPEFCRCPPDGAVSGGTLPCGGHAREYVWCGWLQVPPGDSPSVQRH